MANWRSCSKFLHDSTGLAPISGRCILHGAPAHLFMNLFNIPDDNTLHNEEYYLLYQIKDITETIIDLESKEIPNEIRVNAHNCWYKYGVDGFLTEEDAITNALMILKLAWFKSNQIAIKKITLQYKLIKEIKKHDSAPVCTLSK